MSGERGQALVVAALLIGIGAVAIVGLRAAQERVLDRALTRSAGEAAVEAAAAVVADAYIAHLDSVRARAFEVPRPTVGEAARIAAAEVAAASGAVFADAVDARCDGRSIVIELRHAGRLHRAALEADACSPR